MNYTIPTDTTTYAFIPFRNTYSPVDVHAIAFEYLISPETIPYVHHFVVFGCDDVNATQCPTAIWAWAPGIDPMIVPDVAGFRFGPNGYKSVFINIHYDNPSHVVGLVDNSGVRIHYTANLRQYDAGVLELGDFGVTQPRPIPAGTDIIEYEYNCPSECTGNFTDNLTIFADFLHMHMVGTQMWSTIWRGDQALGELNRVEFWDFNFQQNTLINNRVLRPGDRINTHCIYQQSSSGPVKFAIASQDEMCVEFIYYYPKQKGGVSCGYSYFPGNAQAPARNYTNCLGLPLQLGSTYPYNPTATDPKGGEVRRFGAKNPVTFQCPVIVNPTQQGYSRDATTPIIVGSGSALAASVLLTVSLALL